MKKIIMSWLFCLVTACTFGQDYCRYYSYNDKLCYEMSETKMLIRSDNLDAKEIKNALQNTVAGNLKEIIDMGFGSYLVEMENTSKEKMLELQRQWNAREDVIYVSPILLLGGDESSFANRIIVKLKSKDDYPVLQKCTEAYNIKEIKQLYYGDLLLIGDNDLVYTFALPHNPEKNAMVTACELHETGLFEFAEPNLITIRPFGEPSGNMNIVPGEHTIACYPNPVSDILYVDLEKFVRTQVFFDIRLYNSLGNMYRQTKATGGKVELSVSNLPEGIYFLNIYNGSTSKQETHKIIVKH